MFSSRHPKPLRFEALEPRSLPASVALALVLDAACEGDPAEWAARHRELADVASEQIHYWQQERASQQIVGLFHQASAPNAGPSDESRDLPRPSAKTTEYCEAIDAMIGEAASVEIIQCLDRQTTTQHLGQQYADLVDEVLDHVATRNHD